MGTDCSTYTRKVGTGASFLSSIVNYRLETMPFSVSNRGDISPKFRSVVLLHLSLFLGELSPLLDHYLVTLAIQIIVVTFALAAYPAQAVLAPGTHRVRARAARLKGLAADPERLFGIFGQFLEFLFGEGALGRILLAVAFFALSFHLRGDVFHLLQILFRRRPNVRLTMPRRIRQFSQGMIRRR